MNIDIIKQILKETIQDEDTILMIISEIQNKIKEKEIKPWIIKKGEHFYKAYYSIDVNSINTSYRCNGYDVAKNDDSNFGIVAPTHHEAVELYNALKMQREYEKWCMEYPVDWGNYLQQKYYAYHFPITNEVRIGACFDAQNQGTVYCANIEHIKAFINKVGKADFIKYVMGIGLPKYFLEI